MNYYDTLEISSKASPEVIRMAYKALMKKYHPDVFPDKAIAHKKTLEINEAYSVLSDENKRKAYDTKLKNETNQPKTNNNNNSYANSNTDKNSQTNPTSCSSQQAYSQGKSGSSNQAPIDCLKYQKYNNTEFDIDLVKINWMAVIYGIIFIFIVIVIIAIANR